MKDINESRERAKKLARELEELENEVLNHPDIAQETKDFILKKREEAKQDKLEYEKYLEENKHRKIVGYDPETFKPRYE